MSWDLILSKYKRSLFKDDLALKTIIFIDRNGVSTEDEILESLKVQKEKLSSCLYDLKLNNIIAYEEDFIRLTTSGCKIIDRFELSEYILDDIVFKIEENNNRKNELKTILKFYRDESPYYYHNTNYSIRIWLKLMRDIVKNAEFVIDKDELLGTLKSILYRDIRNWISYSPSSSYIKDSINEDLKILLFSKRPDIDRCKSLDDYSHNYSIAYLSIIDDAVITGESFKKIHINFDKMYKQFYTAQCINLPNQWFELGFSLTNNLPSSKRYTYFQNYLSKIESNLSQRISKNMINNSSYENRILFSKNWLEKSDNILESLLISDSINDFCNYSNLDKHKAIETINQIKIKCDELIKNQ